jgi:GNAT superfamily N-acetyltransferase
MKISAKPVPVQEILAWRDLYRQEMNCQIIHDSLHAREGWTKEYLFLIGDATVGYGSIAVGGPWKGKPTVFEFYVLPQHRARIFDLFSILLTASCAVAIETQSNDVLLTIMLHAFVESASTESILFHDKLTTSHPPSRGALFRRATADDAAQISSQKLDEGAEWVLEVEGAIAATGGILFHYNRPYGDIYMAVAEPFRRQGCGSYLVQELKRICYEQGNVPAARCNPRNVASRKTLVKAGFIPCGHILAGPIKDNS